MISVFSIVRRFKNLKLGLPNFVPADFADYRRGLNNFLRKSAKSAGDKLRRTKYVAEDINMGKENHFYYIIRGMPVRDFYFPFYWDAGRIYH
jgi:hypothetical protein